MDVVIIIVGWWGGPMRKRHENLHKDYPSWAQPISSGATSFCLLRWLHFNSISHRELAKLVWVLSHYLSLGMLASKHKHFFIKFEGSVIVLLKGFWVLHCILPRETRANWIHGGRRFNGFCWWRSDSVMQHHLLIFRLLCNMKTWHNDTTCMRN